MQKLSMQNQHFENYLNGGREHAFNLSAFRPKRIPASREVQGVTL